MGNKKAFTLVEIIVVITILGILATIGFVVYVDYLRSVRDGTRAHQMSSLHSAIELYSTRQKIPLSEDSMRSINYGGITIGHQGDLSQGVLDKIRYSDGGFDPKTKNPYTYFVSKDRKSVQILSFFEEENNPIYAQSIGNPVFANEYSSLYPKVYGAKLGVLINSTSQTPVHMLHAGAIDISVNTSEYEALLTNNEKITGSGDSLYALVPRTDCKKIQSDLGIADSGVYKINVSDEGIRSVYCEMDEANKGYGAGWTLIARTHPDAVGEFGWAYEIGDVYNDESAYSMGKSVENIKFSEVLIAQYDSGKNVTAAVRFDVNNVFFKSQMQSPDTNTKEATTNCEVIYGLLGNTGNCSAFRYWGAFALDTGYGFERYSSGNDSAFRPDGIESTENSLPRPPGNNSLQSTQGMLLVR